MLGSFILNWQATTAADLNLKCAPSRPLDTFCVQSWCSGWPEGIVQYHKNFMQCHDLRPLLRNISRIARGTLHGPHSVTTGLQQQINMVKDMQEP